MKNILILLAIMGCALIVYKQCTQPTYTDSAYVKVYGRDRCKVTQSMIKYLDDESIPYNYYSVDNNKYSDKLHADMQAAGLNTRFYYLPVIEVNGKILVRPEHATVQAIYSEYY